MGSDVQGRAGAAVDLSAEADAIDFWWHSIDLGSGVTTRGRKTPEMLATEWNALHLPDLRRKTVLDIGAWDGYFSFEAERRGASRVVALDYYSWKIDTGRWVESSGPVGPEIASNPLPGKRGFDLAKRALNSQVEEVVGDYMTVDLDQLGTFDIVLYLGVLYHMQEPLLALRRLLPLTRELLVIETHASAFRGFEHHALCEFFEGTELDNDATNWWSPNTRALEGLCRVAGFDDVVTIAGPPSARSSKAPTRGFRQRVRSARYMPEFWDREPERYRHVLHARPRQRGSVEQSVESAL